MPRLAAAALALALLGAPALAQEAAPEPEPEDRITVTGRRMDSTLERQTSRFVGELAAPELGARFGIPRWEGAICVGVSNIAPDRAQFVADRIADVAETVGLRPAGPGCAPNIVIVFAADGAELARAWVAGDRHRFRPFGGAGGTNAGPLALKRFQDSEAPVRWWQVTMPVDQLGDPAIGLNPDATGPAVVKDDGFFLTRRQEDRIVSAMIVVDVNRMNGAAWPQLADYLAMVSLARIDPAARTAGLDTVLNLFDGSAPPGGLTDWDRSFLTALYDFDQMLDPSRQRSALAAAMARDRRAQAQ